MEQPKRKLKQKPKPKQAEHKVQAKDIYAAHKRRKRKKVLRQSAWLLALAIIILVLYQRRDSWIPKLETIGQRHHTQPQAGSSDRGKFPIYLYGDADYQLEEAGGSLMLLTDSYLQIYEPDGTPIAVRQHTYGNALLQTAGDFAMIYESGGTHFRLETAAKQRFEKTLSDPIIFGRVSAGGMTALVTSASTCACKLYVFNNKGQQIYERSCVERLVDVAFTKDESGCYAVSIAAVNGAMHSIVHSYDFQMENDLWQSEPLDTLAISVYNTSVGDVFLLGDTMCAFLTAGGALKSYYVYPDKFLCGRFSGETAALLLSNDEKRTKSLVMLRSDAEVPVNRVYDKDVKDIELMPEAQAVIVQQRRQLDTVSYDGTVLQSNPIADNYDSFLRIGQHLYLRGYDHIDTMNYELTNTVTQ